MIAAKLPTNISEQKINQIILYLALALLLALGLWLRLRFIHTVQLYPDEFVTLLAVRMIGERGLPLMPSGLFYDHGLLFSYAGSLAAWLGPARLAVRYASLLFGTLTLGLTFWLGQRWFSTAVGLIAVTGLAIAPAAIEWSSRARMYALVQLLVLITLWLAFEGLSQNKARWRWVALITYLAATLTHFVAVTLALPMVLAGLGLWWVSRRRRREDAGHRPAHKAPSAQPQPEETQGEVSPLRLAEVAALLLILGIAFLVKRAGQPKGIEALDAAGALPGLAQVFSIYSDFSLNPLAGWQAIAPFYLSLPALIFVPFAIIAMVTSLIFGAKLNSGSVHAATQPGVGAQPAHFPASPPASRRLFASPSQLFLAIILLTTTLEMILFVSPDRRDDKYLFMLLPALFLLGAQGMAVVGGWLLEIQNLARGAPARSIERLTHHVSERSLPLGRITYHPSPLLPLFIAGLILTASQPAVRSLLTNTGDDYDSAFAYVQSHWQPGDTILTGTPAAAAFYLGHNDFYGVQRPGGYDYRLLTVAGQAVDRWLASPAIRTEAELHQTLANHQVWLVLERWGLQREYYDPPFQQQLLAQTDFMAEAQGIFILHSKSKPHPLALNPAQPLEATFANLMRLTGYTVEPEQPSPGESVRLTLYWQALAPLPHDYTVFVHLRQPGGSTLAQADHRPLEPLYPTTLWPVGEIIRESSQLNLPANLSPGNYELWVGLYHLETGERLPVQHDPSGENAVRLGVWGID